MNLHTIAGSPPMRGEAHGICRICGHYGTGMLFDEWVRDTFNDRDKLKPGDIICHACQFLFSEASPVLAAKVGKEKPQRMRNYSHFVVDGDWYPLNKGQKREMRDLLLRCPSLAVVAESGQKHLLFRAKPGWLQFEEQSAPHNPAALQRHIDAIDALYLHFNKVEIASGRYSPHRIKACGVDVFTELEGCAAQLRGGLYFDVALFLAQQEDNNGQTTGERTTARHRKPTTRPDVERIEPGIQSELSL